ncbi:hypothetical protein ACFL2X_06110 [Candidatus Latescibacterota bacterium]
MSSDISVFSKGSIMPSIIELEAGLLENENETLKLAEEEIRRAKLSGKKLLDETVEELSLIEVEERKKLSDDVDAKTEKLKDDEDSKLQKLERNIQKNRKGALEYILKNVIPEWDDHLPD